MSDDEEEDIQTYNFKIVLVGDGAVGKSSISRRFRDGKYSSDYKQTIGVDFDRTKEFFIGKNIRVRLTIWDVGGQQMGSKLLSSYIFGSHGILLVYDVTNYESFKNLEEWHKLVMMSFKKSKGKKPKIGLLANKCDLNHLKVVRESVHEKWAKENNFFSAEVSAKSGDEINTTFLKFSALISNVSVPSNIIENSKMVKATIIDHKEDVEKDKKKKKKKWKLVNFKLKGCRVS